jgi:hypothetical protein
VLTSRACQPPRRWPRGSERGGKPAWKAGPGCPPRSGLPGPGPDGRASRDLAGTAVKATAPQARASRGHPRKFRDPSCPGTEPGIATGGPRSGDRGRGAEVRGPWPGVRGPWQGVRGSGTVAGGPGFRDRGRGAGVQGPWQGGRGAGTVAGGPGFRDRGRGAGIRGPWPGGRGPGTVAGGPGSGDRGRGAEVRGPWPGGLGPETGADDPPRPT